MASSNDGPSTSTNIARNDKTLDSAKTCPSPLDFYREFTQQSSSPVSVAQADFSQEHDCVAREHEGHIPDASTKSSDEPTTHATTIPVAYSTCIASAFGTNVNLYRDIFNVSSTVSERDLRMAYFRQGRAVLTNDASSGIGNIGTQPPLATDKASKSKFQAVSMAYEILSRPEWKDYYDKHGLPMGERVTASMLQGTSSCSHSFDNQPARASSLRLKQKRETMPRRIRWNEHVEELIYTQDEDELLFKLGYSIDNSFQSDVNVTHRKDSLGHGRSSRKSRKKVWLEAQDLGDTLDRFNEDSQQQPSLVASFLNDLEKSLDGLEASVDSFMSFSWMGGGTGDDGGGGNENVKCQDTSTIIHLADDERDVKENVAEIDGDEQSRSIELEYGKAIQGDGLKGLIQMVDEPEIEREPKNIESILHPNLPASSDECPSKDPLYELSPIYDSLISTPQFTAKSFGYIDFPDSKREQNIETRDSAASPTSLVDYPSKAYSPEQEKTADEDFATTVIEAREDACSVESHDASRKNDPTAEIFALLTKPYQTNESLPQAIIEPMARQLFVEIKDKDDEATSIAVDFFRTSSIESSNGKAHSSNLRISREDFVKNFTSDPWKCIESPSPNYEFYKVDKRNATHHQRDKEFVVVAKPHPSNKKAARLEERIVDQSEPNFNPFGDEPPCEEPQTLFSSVVRLDDGEISVSTIGASEAASGWSISAQEKTSDLGISAAQFGNAATSVGKAKPSKSSFPVTVPACNKPYDSAHIHTEVFHSKKSIHDQNKTIQSSSSFATNDSDVLLLDGASSMVSSLTGKPSVVSASMPTCPYIFTINDEGPRIIGERKPDGFGRKAAANDDDFAARLSSFATLVAQEVTNFGDTLLSLFGNDSKGTALDLMLDNIKRPTN
ncbi:hypothetical protein MPSEU_000681200 [Mayamaea pseudoterrestris]|nr:hypothetical protein MPSEU_000681200 [Mayamaea pseudoterrestris]